MTVVKTPADRIFFVQLGDAAREADDALSIRRHHSRLPGEGDLDVPKFLRAVLDTGYEGTISLEIFNERTLLAPPEAARASLRSLDADGIPRAPNRLDLRCYALR